MEYDIRVDTEGTRYYKKGTYIFHREDGPAIEHFDGDTSWLINGKYHRTDGPAKDWVSDGYKAWFVNGKCHRTDGPAIEYADGDKEWYINGERLSPEKETILNKWWNNKNGI